MHGEVRRAVLGTDFLWGDALSNGGKRSCVQGPTVPFSSDLQGGWCFSPGRWAFTAGSAPSLAVLAGACLELACSETGGRAVLQGLCVPCPIAAAAQHPGQDKAALVWMKQLQSTFSSVGELPP